MSSFHVRNKEEKMTKAEGRKKEPKKDYEKPSIVPVEICTDETLRMASGWIDD
jgi:hypothetical protein